MRFLDIVNDKYECLNQNEISLCDFILNNIEFVKNSSILDVAKKSYSSKSSVIRFAQKLGFTGFSELRNFLKWQDNADKLNDTITFKDQVIADVNYLLTDLATSDFEPIYFELDKIDNIYIIYTGITQKNQASELRRLFLLIGKNVHVILSDGNSNEFKRILERLSEKDIVFVLSLSGQNNSLEEIMLKLKIVRSKIVSITSYQNNFLSKESDYSLYAYTSRSPLPKDWWLQTCSSFFILIEAFAFGYMDHINKKR